MKVSKKLPLILTSLCLIMMLGWTTKSDASQCNELLKECAALAKKQQQTLADFQVERKEREAVIEEQQLQLNEAQKSVKTATKRTWITTILFFIAMIL